MPQEGVDSGGRLPMASLLPSPSQALMLLALVVLLCLLRAVPLLMRVAIANILESLLCSICLGHRLLSAFKYLLWPPGS